MPPSSSRILLSLILFAATPFAWGLSFRLLQTFSSYQYAVALFSATGTVSIIIFSVLWWLIWFKQILWNNSKKLGTTIAFITAIIIAVAGGTALGFAIEEGFTPGYIMGLIFFAISWVAGCCIAWRQTDAERAIQLAQMGLGVILCPNCGYNISQQPETNCPECGKQHTLNQVLAHTLSKVADR